MMAVVVGGIDIDYVRQSPMTTNAFASNMHLIESHQSLVVRRTRYPRSLSMALHCSREGTGPNTAHMHRRYCEMAGVRSDPQSTGRNTMLQRVFLAQGQRTETGCLYAAASLQHHTVLLAHTRVPSIRESVVQCNWQPPTTI